ncbi:MAG: aspartate--tRNA ligase [Patescibacteria group bacterium]
MQNRTLIKDLKNKVGETVTLAGWVDARRDHGKLIFLDLREATGKVQMVALPNHTEVHQVAATLRNEWVIKVTGQVNKRPLKMINPDWPNGDLEIEILTLEILNEATPPAIPVDSDGWEIGEENRLKFRYLDLRRPRLQKNLRFRHRLIKFIRDYLSEREFIEVETPILTKTTPEGARDYLVPARLYPGNFYALPQSPQQYKQLLMVAGVERYFQIARCFRDEDTRGDRQPEFTQLDLEIAFAAQEEVMRLNEELLIALVQKLSPEKKILQIPFPRLTYREAMEKYGTDRPDLRPAASAADENKTILAFCWVIDFPFFEKDEKENWIFTHNPFSAPKSEFLESLIKKEKIGEIITSQYDITLNGFEIGGGSLRNHRPENLKSVLEILGHNHNDIQTNFGHMLQALASGAPPHGGIAWGLDRLISLLANEPNIREVIAFPKTGEGRDLMMNAPAPATAEQLKELWLKSLR